MNKELTEKRVLAERATITVDLWDLDDASAILADWFRENAARLEMAICYPGQESARAALMTWLRVMIPWLTKNAWRVALADPLGEMPGDFQECLMVAQAAMLARAGVTKFPLGTVPVPFPDDDLLPAGLRTLDPETVKSRARILFSLGVPEADVTQALLRRFAGVTDDLLVDAIQDAAECKREVAAQIVAEVLAARKVGQENETSDDSEHSALAAPGN